jgi:hypothetical protein
MELRPNVYFDRIKESSPSIGSGLYTLSGAPSGFVTFSSVLSDGQYFDYGVTTQSGADWENGRGRYSASGNTITVVTVNASSENGQPIVWASQIKYIFLTADANSIQQIQDDTVYNSLILG